MKDISKKRPSKGSGSPIENGKGSLYTYCWNIHNAMGEPNQVYCRPLPVVHPYLVPSALITIFKTRLPRTPHSLKSLYSTTPGQHRTRRAGRTVPKVVGGEAPCITLHLLDSHMCREKLGIPLTS